MTRTPGMRGWLAERLRFWADRIDYDGAPKCISPFAYTFERGRGMVVNDKGRGCSLWYLGGEAEHEKAFTEAIDPVVRVNWQNLATGVGPATTDYGARR